MFRRSVFHSSPELQSALTAECSAARSVQEYSNLAILMAAAWSMRDQSGWNTALTAAESVNLGNIPGGVIGMAVARSSKCDDSRTATAEALAYVFVIRGPEAAVAAEAAVGAFYYPDLAHPFEVAEILSEVRSFPALAQPVWGMVFMASAHWLWGCHTQLRERAEDSPLQRFSASTLIVPRH